MENRSRSQVLVLLFVGVLMGALDIAIVGPALPNIRAWFGVAGRAIQGAGGGGVFPVASAVIGDTFPPEKRGSALGLIGAVFGIAFLIGPILGGIILSFTS